MPSWLGYVKLSQTELDRVVERLVLNIVVLERILRLEHALRIKHDGLLLSKVLTLRVSSSVIIANH